MKTKVTMSIEKSSFMTLFFCLLLSLPLVTLCDQTHQDFLQCLSLYSENSSSITKVIHTPLNSSYSSILDVSLHNLRFLNASKPVVIITPLQVSHIQASVYCSQKYGLQIRIRSGGHDYEGLSYVSKIPFAIIDMVNFRSIDVDVENRTAWVQSGALIGELYYRIAEKSQTLGFPAATCPTVGIGGHFSGGGYSMMMRKYGVAADHIIDAQLIDVNGKLLGRKSMGEDLFWAIRGGGGGSFGIVVSWKIELVDVPSTVTVFSPPRILEQNATELVYKWQLVAADELPKELFIRIILQSHNGSSGNQTIQATFNSLYLGGVDDLLRIMNESFLELNLTQDDCTEMSWIESVLYFAGFSGETSLEILLNRTSNTKGYFKNKSDYVKKPIPISRLEEIWDWFFEQDQGAVHLIWSPYGGVMNEISESTIPFPHRAGCLYLIQHITSWTQEGEEVSKRHISWIRRFYAYMAQYVSNSPRQAYINYRDLDIGVNNIGNTSYTQAKIWGEKYFKNNFARLVRVKTMVDPRNFFRHEQSIPSLSPW